MFDRNCHSFLKVALHERMAGSSLERKGGDILHASTISNSEFCAREFVLISHCKVFPRHEYVSTSLRFTWELGDAAARVVAAYLKDILWGDWSCNHCGFLIVGSKCPSVCACESREFEYQEHRFRSRLSGASCSADLIFKFPWETKLILGELKTMEKDGFRELQAPLGDHRHRLSLYLRIIEESGEPGFDLTKGHLLYMDKGFGCKSNDGILEEADIRERTSPFKEFVVQRDDSGIESVIKDANKVKAYRDNGIIPGRICSSLMDPRAKKCPVRSQCFSGEYG